MNTIFYPSSERGHADFGWLKARYSFSFGQWHDPKKIHFGVLRVLNDDVIAGGGGFPTHPHDNMEIITIPLSGALAHKDSTGGQGIITAGDVQIMSAGTGVRHSEFNASATAPVSLLQIWLFPKQKNIEPRYDQKNYPLTERINQWQVVASGDKADEESMWINQDARFALTTLQKDHSLTYSLNYSGNGVYAFLINGSIDANGVSLNTRDAVGITETEVVQFTASENSELLVIELPV
jgi:hypothetical protein